MHPYYGSDRLVTASPTLIESVQSEETEMLSNNGTGPPTDHGPESLYSTPAQGGVGLGQVLNSTQVSGSGILGNQFPMSIYHTPYTTHYQPVPIATHALMSQAGPSVGLSSSSSSIFNGYNPPFIPSTTPYIQTSAPYLPHPTSTPSVQFITPSTAQESLNTYTNRIHSPRVSPTYSNPPIQMIAPRPDSVLWQHTVPTSMPWVPVGTSANIHFTATSTPSHNSTTMTNSPPKRLIKRKSTFDDTGVPEKVHVNEERMAARLETLHLDNNNLQWHPDLEDQWYSQKQDSTSCTISTTSRTTATTQSDDKEKEDKATLIDGVEGLRTNQVGGSRLNFSDLLKMGIKSQEILPKLIMDEISKPCMQVVLWKPPGNFVQHMVRDVTRDVSPEAATEMNDIGNGDSNVNNDVMETVSPPLSSLSWTPHVKTSESTAMDDMEL